MEPRTITSAEERPDGLCTDRVGKRGSQRADTVPDSRAFLRSPPAVSKSRALRNFEIVDLSCARPAKALRVRESAALGDRRFIPSSSLSARLSDRSSRLGHLLARLRTNPPRPQNPEKPADGSRRSSIGLSDCFGFARSTRPSAHPRAAPTCRAGSLPGGSPRQFAPWNMCTAHVLTLIRIVLSMTPFVACSSSFIFSARRSAPRPRQQSDAHRASLILTFSHAAVGAAIYNDAWSARPGPSP